MVQNVQYFIVAENIFDITISYEKYFAKKKLSTSMIEALTTNTTGNFDLLLSA